VEIFSSLDNVKIAKPILTIGSFDGVHLGHKQVIDKLNKESDKRNGQSTVFTFWPHPSMVLHPESKLKLLSTLDEKISLLEKIGVSNLILVPFSKEFSQIEYTDFVKSTLVERLHIDTLLLGYDNKMGRNGEGRFNEVGLLSKKYGFNILTMSAISTESTPISSTKIREFLAQGKVKEAAGMLGRDYSISGEVVSGNHIGTTIGFPTANLQPDECKFVPGRGVYAVRADIGGQEYLGMLNIGVRPTISGPNSATSIETHLFDFKGNLYGRSITVHFVDKVRDERQFADIGELQNQLQRDSLLIRGKYRL